MWQVAKHGLLGPVWPSSLFYQPCWQCRCWVLRSGTFLFWMACDKLCVKRLSDLPIQLSAAKTGSGEAGFCWNSQTLRAAGRAVPVHQSMVERPSALQSRAKVRRLRSQRSASHPRSTAHVRSHRSQARPASDRCPQMLPPVRMASHLQVYAVWSIAACHLGLMSQQDMNIRTTCRLEIRAATACMSGKDPLRGTLGRYCVWTGAHMQGHPLQKWPVCGRVRAIPGAWLAK